MKFEINKTKLKIAVDDVFNTIRKHSTHTVTMLSIIKAVEVTLITSFMIKKLGIKRLEEKNKK